MCLCSYVANYNLVFQTTFLSFLPSLSYFRPFNISSTSIRHLFNISSTSLRHLFDIFSTSLRHLFDISLTSLRHLFDISSAYLQHLFNISLTSLHHLFNISSTSLQHLFSISSTSLQHLFNIFSASLQHQIFRFSICHVYFIVHSNCSYQYTCMSLHSCTQIISLESSGLDSRLYNLIMCRSAINLLFINNYYTNVLVNCTLAHY